MGHLRSYFSRFDDGEDLHAPRPCVGVDLFGPSRIHGVVGALVPSRRNLRRNLRRDLAHLDVSRCNLCYYSEIARITARWAASHIASRARRFASLSVITSTTLGPRAASAAA